MITLLTHICDIPVFSILILILMITKNDTNIDNTEYITRVM